MSMEKTTLPAKTMLPSKTTTTTQSNSLAVLRRIVHSMIIIFPVCIQTQLLSGKGREEPSWKKDVDFLGGRERFGSWARAGLLWGQASLKMMLWPNPPLHDPPSPSTISTTKGGFAFHCSDYKTQASS